MKKLKIMEWSLNLSSSLVATIPNNWVLDSMKIKDIGENKKTFPDITFLNEVVLCNDSCKELIRAFENEGFRVICSNNNHGNQVAIALNGDFKIKNIVYQVPYIKTYYSPDFLHVEAEYDGIVYNIVALRIRINSKTTDEEYKHRNIQFQCYKNYISKLTNVISAGDFNHARILGNEDDISEKSQIIYREKQVSQRFYNYQMIKNEIETHMIDKKSVWTPKNNSKYTSANGKNKTANLSSVGIKLYKDVFKYPCIYAKNNFKIDHFVVSESIGGFSEPYYDWNFLQKFLGENNSAKDYFCKIKNKLQVKTGYPDHGMLIADITITNSVDKDI